MYPILLQFGKITIYTYGFFVALGFLTGITLAKYEAKRLGEDPEKIIDLSFYILISAIIGARLFYVFTMPETFFSDPLEIFKIWNGGLVFYGGFIAAAITAVIFLKKKNMPLWKTADIVAPALAIGHFLGRIGCFFAGCCYGKECDLPWAITFTHPETLAPMNIPIHPTQLYSSLNNLCIFFILWYLRKRKRFDGEVFWIYVFIYGLTRSFIEIFRGDFRGDIFFGILSLSQTIGISFSLIAAGMLIFLNHRAKNK